MYHVRGVFYFLRSLSLGGNNLVGDLPLSLTALIALQSLSLGDNYISSAPAQVPRCHPSTSHA